MECTAWPNKDGAPKTAPVHIRLHLSDLEALGLIRREPFGKGYRILFESPDRERIKAGMAAIEVRKQERHERRKAAKAAKTAEAV